MEAEIADMQKEIEIQKEKAVAAVERTDKYKARAFDAVLCIAFYGLVVASCGN